MSTFGVFALGGLQPLPLAWSTETPAPHRIAIPHAHAYGTEIFLIGQPDNQADQVVYTYTPSTDLWALKPTVPPSFVGGSGAIIGATIYNFSSNSVKAYDIATDTWTTKANGPGGRNFTFGSAVAVGTLIYVFTNTAIDIYDTVADSWSALVVGSSRSFAAGRAIGAYIYLAGGQGAFATRLDRFDPATSIWSALTAMPSGRTAPASAVKDGELYVLGGLNSTPAPTANVQVYDPVAASWGSIDDMPHARSQMAGVTFGDAIYVMAGEHGAAAGTYDFTDRYGA